MKPNKLSYIYDKRQKDFVSRGPRTTDVNLLFYLFGDILRFDLYKYGKEVPYEVFNALNELENRGYDLTTIKFSIELKEPVEQHKQ